jgi:hypothetical protein
MLVSNRLVEIEPDSLPLHVFTEESLPQYLQVVRVLTDRPELWRLYGSALAWVHPGLVKEIQTMGRIKAKSKYADPAPLLEMLRLEEIVRQRGPRGLVDELGVKGVVDLIGVNSFFEALSPEDREELARLQAKASARPKKK